MKKVKRSLAVLLAAVILTCAVSMLNVSAWNGGGILNNGLGGIYIDIYKHPYTDSRWNAYGAPYGTGGCTWFVGARVMELTGKGTYNTQVGKTWYNTYGPNLGFTSDQNPSGGSVICWSGHVAILEKIEGSTAYISEGGAAGYRDGNGTWHSCSNNDYCKLSTCDVASIPGRESGFIGYVHFGTNHNPFGYIDEISGGEGFIHVSGWTMDNDDLTKSLQIHVYIGGSSATPNVMSLAIDANKSRKDVDAVYHCGEFHGFDAKIQTSLTGNQPVYIYAINIGQGGNIELGHQTVSITKHYHSYSSKITKAPTCSATGVRTYTCSCGDSYTEPIAKNPNNHVNTKNVAATASTCTVKGYTAGVYCNDCKKYISGHQEQPLAAHKTTIINAKDATATAEGYTGDEYCTVCKQIINKGSVVPKLTGTEQDSPNEQNQQEKTGGCPWCGQTHKGVIIAFLVAMFHVMLAAIFGARY